MSVESSPLAQSLERATTLDEYLVARIAEPNEPDWLPATSLTDPATLSTILEGFAASRKLAKRRLTGSFFISSYVWYLAGAAIASLLIDQRIPDLDRTNVLARFPSNGNADQAAIAFASQRFFGLAVDQTQTGATVIADKAGLREQLRQQFEQHLEPVVQLVADQSGLGQRAQWNIIADRCAGIFLRVGQRLDQVAAACEEGLAFVGTKGSAMKASKTGYIQLDTAGDTCATFLQRGGCCLYYQVEGGRNCNDCPLLPTAERLQRMAGLSS
ncbi:ferric iron reductase [Herpetosiphon gulosus]|uniref:Ferric siderophore reductase C-terminal domain-containing protein n=1 Tax=Herpetosiphon gulosus TaxID=1973496 RepID=A0ABP9WZS1_9CHLR